jgi:integrase
VPMVKQLRARMRAEWERQGRPQSGPIFKPKRADNRSGTADLNAALRRITKKWTKSAGSDQLSGLAPHTAATWLDHGGVSPKVASVIMGHKSPKLRAQPDAAPITLRRYTHVLEGELKRACVELEAFLTEREEEERRAPADTAPAG